MKTDISTIHKVGSMSQLAGTRHCILTDGGAGGVRAIDVNTGAGLTYTILPDRGMDISLASFKGINFSYLTPQEVLSAAYYNSHHREWLRTFFAGLLTTCGPVNIGPPCEDNGVSHGIHGRFNVTPATNVCDKSDVENGVIMVSGSVANYVTFGEKLEIRRTISSVAGENSITISDIVINHGDVPTPNMMMYHINFGYPLLDAGVKVSVNGKSYAGYDDYSQQHISDVWTFGQPDAGNSEKSYLHIMDSGTPGRAGIYNDALGFGVEIKFDAEALPYLTHWKYERARDYVLALEPGNAPCVGVAESRMAGNLPFLKPGCRADYSVEISVIE